MSAIDLREGDVPAPLPAAAERVATALRGLGVEANIVLTSASARTAEEAADALAVAVGQIAKSLIFRTEQSGRAVLVVAAGDNRVDESKLGQLLGEPVVRASAEFVRATTGFAIGGVAPIGYPEPITVICDATLLRFDQVWAAAGSPRAVFAISPHDLLRVTGARLADVRLDA